MSEVSILDQILDTQKIEEVSGLNAIEIIDGLFSELSARERDVLVRRYGLDLIEKETLEKIGQKHNLTRERIRQIEISALRKLREVENLEKHLSSLKKIISHILEEHGGLVEKDYLLELLASFSSDGMKMKITDSDKHRNYLNFMINKLLHNEFEEIVNSKNLKEAYKLRGVNISYIEEVAEELTETLNSKKEILNMKEAMAIFEQLQSFQKNKEKMSARNVLDVARFNKRVLNPDEASFVNNNKIHYTILRAAKRIEQNKFGHWGLSHWREVNPKTINDKIYLILKDYKQPLHFAEIAEKINQVGFDMKQANSATVHNELILDEKYVLIGRGLYGLREWGYRNGSVIDVIADVLGQFGAPLSRDEIITKVLERKIVKKATIVLALMNKNKFDKIDNKYLLKK